MAKDHPPMWTRKIVSLPRDLAKAIDDYRFVNRIASEAEAIRRLLESALKKKGAP